MQVTHLFISYTIEQGNFRFAPCNCLSCSKTLQSSDSLISIIPSASAGSECGSISVSALPVVSGWIAEPCPIISIKVSCTT